MKSWILAVAVLAASCLSAPMASAATVYTDAASIANFTAGGPAGRARSQNTGNELYVGSGDLGVGGNRAEAAVTYAASQAFSLSYNKDTGVVAGSIGSANQVFSAAAGLGFNALSVNITGPNTGTGSYFSLTGVTVNGEAAGDFTGAMPPDARTTVTSIISGFALSGSTITLLGTLNYFGPLGTNISAEQAAVNVKFGEFAPIPLPAAAWLLLAGIGGLGMVSRRRRAAA